MIIVNRNAYFGAYFGPSDQHTDQKISVKILVFLLLLLVGCGPGAAALSAPCSFNLPKPIS